VVVLPETDLPEACIAAERIRKLVAEHPFQYADKPYKLTVSLGVAANTGTDVLSSADLIGRADEKLYQAKHDGRNRVVA
jgi:diguanylate cyclase (GGDEF)-like protein